MKFKFLFIIAFLAIGNSLFAQYTLNSTRRMSPGVKYMEYSTTSPARKIFVLEISLAEPTVELEVVKSGNMINANPESVSTMFNNNDTFVYHDVSGGINADFFTINSTYKNPTNVLINKGEIMWNYPSARSVFGITEDRIPFITNINENYKLIIGSNNYTINKINKERAANELVLYNRFIGTSTQTASGSGVEVKIVPVNGKNEWKANGIVQCKVLAKEVNAGNMSFAAGEAVLSANGTAASYINSLNVNDIISLDLNVSSAPANIKELTGGRVRLVNNGVNYSAQGVINEGDAKSTSREPRTAVGHTQDNKKVFLVVVDGRSTISEGMTLSEMANFLIYLGCYQGLNLDGGGSSTMVANGVLKNVPSDGTERLVANALLAYTNTKTLDDFESGLGHFNKAPTHSSTTTGISTTSSVSVGTTAHSGYQSLKVNLIDNASSSAAWKVRLLSGNGDPSNNRQFNKGAISLWIKTSTASSTAKVRLWVDDSDGHEVSPALNVISDGNWHKYVWNIANFGGTSPDGGNGTINSTAAYLDAIELSQANTSTTWTLYIDDIMHDRNASPTIPNSVSNTKINILNKPSKEIDLIRVYPNPTTSSIVVELNNKEEDFTVTIFDLQGKKHLQETYYGKRENIDLNYLKNGMYIVEVTNNQKTDRVKIIKESK